MSTSDRRVLTPAEARELGALVDALAAAECERTLCLARPRRDAEAQEREKADLTEAVHAERQRIYDWTARHTDYDLDTAATPATAEATT